MLPFLALLAIQVPVQQPPRLRTILPNGAIVLVEPVKGAKIVWTRLFLSARGAEDTPATHGLRHMLEHLVATGRYGRLDERLEREGAFLRAQTLRDATEFAVDAPKDRLDLALGALGEMLRLRALTPEEIRREANILRQEGALREPARRLAAAAWSIAYGAKGLDTFGDEDAFRRATPAALSALHRRLCAGPNLVIVVSGDVDLDAATAQAAKIVATAPKVEAKWDVRPPGKGGAVNLDVPGEACALPVRSYDEPTTVAALAVALALASGLDDAFVTYTPSERPGLVVLGRTGFTTGLAAIVAKAKPEDLWRPGRLLVRNWLDRQTANPAANASLRGLLLAQSLGAGPLPMREAVDAMTFSQFSAALTAFKGTNAVTVTSP